MPAPETCPNCGADVPRRAKACPECGSDESTGWSDQAATQSLDLPDDEFNYEEFTEREFGKPKRSPIKVFWWLVAVGLLSATLFFLLRW
ncbi:MAG TPA: zinc-ribbon domain-containing protein [Candidatus Limnocylindria bacterium]|nr:zinc-ribbon domain-containing protein [Candidatus Limnocylindria bacterium]